MIYKQIKNDLLELVSKPDPCNLHRSVWGVIKSLDSIYTTEILDEAHANLTKLLGKITLLQSELEPIKTRVNSALMLFDPDNVQVNQMVEAINAVNDYDQFTQKVKAM